MPAAQEGGELIEVGPEYEQIAVVCSCKIEVTVVFTLMAFMEKPEGKMVFIRSQSQDLFKFVDL